MLALLVAACFLIARVLRLGWIADYFSRPVLIGYIHGSRSCSSSASSASCSGSTIDAREPLDAARGRCVQELGDLSGATLAVGARRARHAAPAAPASCRCLPAALLVVVAAIARLVGVRPRRATASRVVGAIPAGLPSSTLPTPRSATSSGSCRPPSASSSSRSPTRSSPRAHSPASTAEHVRASQELLAMGPRTPPPGFTQGFSIGASGSRTAVNDAWAPAPRSPGCSPRGRSSLILLFLTEPIAVPARRRYSAR